MTFPSKLADDAKVFDAFLTWPDVYQPWMQVCQEVLRGPSPLSEGARELIGTFVSKLNDCRYCYAVHNSAVKAYGLDDGLVANLIDDIDTAEADAKLKPILRYVRKLTETPYKMTQQDADAVFAAGWDDDALHSAIAVTALFSFMNRFVFGLGIEEDADYSRVAGARIKAMGYLGPAKMSKEERDRFAARPAAE